MDYTRLHRLLHIITLIQSGTGWNVKRLSEKCGATERTIYRDLQTLKDTGIPCEYDEMRECYRIRQDFFMPPVQLTMDEAIALMLLGEQVSDGEAQIPFTAPAFKALLKLKNHLPAAIRKELDELDEAVHVSLARTAPGDSYDDVFVTIRQAIVDRRTLRCSYDSLNDGPASDDEEEPEVFLFEPYTLLFNKRTWYAIGLHHAREELRCMRLSRFTRVEVTDRPFAIPDDYDLDSYLGNAWRIMRGSTRYDVSLRFSPQFAETIADTHWHPSQQVEWLEDDAIRFRCQVDGLDEIVWWVLSMGPNCVVEQPTELADRVRDLARQTAQLYND